MAVPNIKVAFWLVFYLLCSSTMLIVNKLAVVALPLPNLLLLAQVFASVVLVVLAHFTKLTTVDFNNWSKAWEWRYVMFWWLMPMITNMMALKVVTVETVIIFRTLSVFAVAGGDYFFFGKKFSIIQISGMILIFVGSVVYSSADVNYDAYGYFWAFLYFGATVVNSLYVKMVFDKMTSMSNVEKMYYQNLVAVPALLVLSLIADPLDKLGAAVEDMSLSGVTAVVLSCFMGTMISLAGTFLRDLVSPTSFNIAGNSNKFATVLFSAVLLQAQNTSTALMGLVIALIGGATYALAPGPKKIPEQAQEASNNDVETNDDTERESK
mmetsp:Transcript_29833/g.77007  ORF Transcript_29833/g.77007 Transcript_29833/m.77007 type:complete len:324 (+) Transcript_29833:166-1137(+)